MTGERVERRLAAVLAADVAGFSRLFGADEEGVLARLRALRAEVINPEVVARDGRVFKNTGDGRIPQRRLGNPLRARNPADIREPQRGPSLRPPA